MDRDFSNEAPEEHSGLTRNRLIISLNCRNPTENSKKEIRGYNVHMKTTHRLRFRSL